MLGLQGPEREMRRYGMLKPCTMSSLHLQQIQLTFLHP